MRLEAYFTRIGYSGRARVDLETLNALHRAHLQAIPFENIDVQLGRHIEIAPESVFSKLVTRRRGGWCYEQNGLFGWALREIGFDVTRVAASVMRRTHGLPANHLCLLVRLGEPYLADVGFGGSLAAPLPLRKISRRDAPFDVSLDQLDDGHWRFSEVAIDTAGEPFSFDFLAEPADESQLARTCAWLQTAPDSNFVLNFVVQRRRAATHTTLRGRTLRSSGGEERRLLKTADDLVAVLHGIFGLDVPEAAALWPAICARHETLFPSG